MQQKTGKMGTKTMTMLLAAVLAIATVLVSVSGVQTVYAKESQYMGYYYAAKGQPMVFQDKAAKKLKVISAAGNKYKVSGNKITITCNKRGTVKYKINGKNRSFDIIISVYYDDGKIDKVDKQEYDMIDVEYDEGGKTYNNFVDLLRENEKDIKKTCPYGIYYEFTDKEELKKMKKYNRGIEKGSREYEVGDAYPSYEDLGMWGDDESRCAARYYDKKSGFVLTKEFVLDKNHKVKSVIYDSYNPKSKKCINQLTVI